MAEVGGLRGGILALLDLIEEHRAAVEYDFRSRFPGLPHGVYSVPDLMGWGEAIRAIRTLRADPATQLAAAIEEWDYPLSREAAIFADLYDLEYAKTGIKSRKPYPRPYKVKGKTEKWGNTGDLTRDEVVAILNGLGHSLS